MNWARPTVLRTLWAGWAASVLATVLGTIAALAAPHVRGLGFHPSLRLGIVSPVCAVGAIAFSFLYRDLSGRVSRPRMVLATAVAAVAAVLVAWAVSGSSQAAAQTLPAVLIAALAMVWWIPRFVDQPRPSRAGAAAIVLLGTLEIFGLAGALSSERSTRPSSVSLPFDLPRDMFDVEHKFVDLPSGARVHYVDEGAGETLLFLHGNPSWSFQWRDLIRRLRGSYRCVALDYPGFGMSTAPANFGFTPREESRVLEEFVDRLGLRDTTLVMQDWGGPIGLGFAGRRPELVSRVVLGSTWAWPTTTAEPRGKFSVIAGGPIGEFAQVNFNAFATFGIQNGISHNASRELLDVYVRPFVPIEHRGIAAFYPGQILAATDYFVEVEAELSRLASKRALIFWAGQDIGFPRSDSARFEVAFSRHKTVDLPNANHFFFEDTAEQVVAEIRDFMVSDQGRATGKGPP